MERSGAALSGIIQCTRGMRYQYENQTLNRCTSIFSRKRRSELQEVASSAVVWSDDGDSISIRILFNMAIICSQAIFRPYGAIDVVRTEFRGVACQVELLLIN